MNLDRELYTENASKLNQQRYSHKMFIFLLHISTESRTANI